MKLSDVGERKIIEILEGIVGSHGILGFGDDVYAFKYGKVYVTFKIDGVAINFFKLPWMSYYDVGWKAVMMISSDIIAKLSIPKAFMVSIGVPRGFSLEDLLSIVKGSTDASKAINSILVGGDLNESESEEWIDVAGIGLSQVKPIGRRGARPGDLLLTTGSYGVTSAVYHYVFKKGKMPSENVKSYLTEKTKKPKPPVEAISILQKYRRYITSTIDSSDGLAASLWWLSKINNVGFKLQNIPVDENAMKYAEYNSLDTIELSLYGGEEFEIILTMKKNVPKDIFEELENVGIKLTIIGEVVESKGIWVLKDNKYVKVEGKGWEYFTGGINDD